MNTEPQVNQGNQQGGGQRPPPFKILKDQTGATVKKPVMTVAVDDEEPVLPHSEYAYIVVTPNPADYRQTLAQRNITVTVQRPNNANNNPNIPVMWFKVGDHNKWDGSKSAYNRCNPSHFYRSMKIADDPNLQQVAGPGKTIENVIFSNNQYPAYTRIAGTEWYMTTDPTNIQRLIDLAAQWDNNWQVNNRPDPNVAALGVLGGPVNRQTLGPSFEHVQNVNTRATAANWLRGRI